MDHFSLLSLFLLGISSLLPLVNPVGTALIINPFFEKSSLAERKSFARAIMASCLMLGVATLLLGSWCLKFMGISISTTQMAGGLLIARMGLNLLNSEAQSDQHANRPTNIEDSLFYPLAFPLTVGPGVISALITLSAHAHDRDLTLTWIHIGVLCLSLTAVLILTYYCFVYSGRLIKRIGKSGSVVLNRLMAFLVFCIGIQMLVTGLARSFPRLFE